MGSAEDEIILYGIDDINEKVNSIINTLDLKEQYFEVKLIMFEAIFNAFIHGNNNDKSKPIYVKWKLEENLLRIGVTDCGAGFDKSLQVCREIDEKDIWDEGGRGLYIIRCYTDNMELKGNSIIMEKYL